MRQWVLRGREPKASKGCVVAARVVVVLAGLLFAAFGALLIWGGWDDSSWEMIGGGAVIVLPSLGLIWSAITSNPGDVGEAAVILVSELLSGMFG